MIRGSKMEVVFCFVIMAAGIVMAFVAAGVALINAGICQKEEE